MFTRSCHPPIVFAALCGGTGAGRSAALLATALDLPPVIVGWHPWPAVQVGQHTEVAVFRPIGVVAGRIGTKLWRERDRARFTGPQVGHGPGPFAGTPWGERLRIGRDVTVEQIAAGMAHDVRTPPGAAREALAIVESSAISPECRLEFAEIARGDRAGVARAGRSAGVRPTPPAGDAADGSREAGEPDGPCHRAHSGVRLEPGPVPGNPVVASVDPDPAPACSRHAAPRASGHQWRTPRRSGGRSDGRPSVITTRMQESSGPSRLTPLSEPLSDAHVGREPDAGIGRAPRGESWGLVPVRSERHAGGVRPCGRPPVRGDSRPLVRSSTLPKSLRRPAPSAASRPAAP